MTWHEITLLLVGGLAGCLVVIGRRHTTAAIALGLVILCVGAWAWTCDAMLVARLSAALGLVTVLSAPLYPVPERVSRRWHEIALSRRWAVILTVVIACPVLLYVLMYPVGSAGIAGSILSDTNAMDSHGRLGQGSAEATLLAALVVAWVLSSWGKKSK